jgi:hypothetical protein
MPKQIYILPPDNLGRPVVVYRSALHTPGKIDNKLFARYAIQLLEKGRAEYGLGMTTESCIIVDRVGSGKKNQDIALVQELVPTMQTHYPGTVGVILIAPINVVVS